MWGRRERDEERGLVWKTRFSQTFCTTFVPLPGNGATGVLLRLILAFKEVNSISFMIQSTQVLYLYTTFPPLRQNYLFIQISNSRKVPGCQENHPATTCIFSLRAQKKTEIGYHTSYAEAEFS